MSIVIKIQFFLLNKYDKQHFPNDKHNSTKIIIHQFLKQIINNLTDKNQLMKGW